MLTFRADELMFMFGGHTSSAGTATRTTGVRECSLIHRRAWSPFVP